MVSEMHHKLWNLDQEYRAIREEAGLLELSGYEILEVTGRDRIRFLHGMLSNDIKALDDGQGCLAAMLNTQGKTLAVMQVLCRKENLLLLLGPGFVERVQTHLRRYIISDQVELASQAGHAIILSLQGRRSIEILRSCAKVPEALNPYDHFPLLLGEKTAHLVVSDRSGRGGADLMVQRADYAQIRRYLLESSSIQGILPVSLDALNIHRIEAGIPWYGVDADESNLPLEAGFEKTISYKKGCYLGQEIIARATFRGHLNRKLMGLALEGNRPAFNGDNVFQDEKEVGRVTSSVFSPALLHPVALAYLRREVWESGMELLVKSGEEFIKAKVAELPFVGTTEV